jgi:hypothetical protein
MAAGAPLAIERLPARHLGRLGRDEKTRESIRAGVPESISGLEAASLTCPLVAKG